MTDKGYRQFMNDLYGGRVLGLGQLGDDEAISIGDSFRQVRFRWGSFINAMHEWSVLVSKRLLQSAGRLIFPRKRKK